MIKEAIVRALRWIVKGTPNVRITANIVETAPQNRLAGKKVIVTGGGRGLGFYIARKCRQEGASVLIAGRDERVLQEASQRLCDCPYLVFDVRRTAGIAAFLSEADRLLGGRVDCLVNNAGISLHEKSFADVTEEGVRSPIRHEPQRPLFPDSDFHRLHEQRENRTRQHPIYYFGKRSLLRRHSLRVDQGGDQQSHDRPRPSTDRSGDSGQCDRTRRNGFRHDGGR